MKPRIHLLASEQSSMFQLYSCTAPDTHPGRGPTPADAFHAWNWANSSAFDVAIAIPHPPRLVSMPNQSILELGPIRQPRTAWTAFKEMVGFA